jgi:uncharacterized DUF497 family protein
MGVWAKRLSATADALIWDESKDTSNVRKHGVSFKEILAVFDDPDFLESYDDEHSETEDRYYGIGCLNNVLFVIVFYTEPGKRVISAQQADAQEREEYDDTFKRINP